MNQYTQNLALVVANGVLKNSSDTFFILDPDSEGQKTFSVAMSETGVLPVTFWGAYTILETTTHDHLLNDTTQEFKDYVNEVALERGREPIGSVTAFKNSVRMSEEGADFWAYVGSLGLMLITSGDV